MRAFLRICVLMLSLIVAPVAAWAQQGAPITVFAAASLTDAMQAAGKAFTARTGTPVRFSFASSAALARQIEAGAPADLFLSADLEWMDHAQAQGAIDPKSRVNLLQNSLVLIAPRGSAPRERIRIGQPIVRALGPDGRLAVGDPDTVPAGRYAKAALTSLGLWDQLAGRLARAENVRFALQLVARRETPLGIVYITDALVEPDVRVVGVFSPHDHPPIVYPMALTRKADPKAAAFARFLASREGKAVFHKFGFRTAAR